jgi:hypothetical protein
MVRPENWGHIVTKPQGGKRQRDASSQGRIIPGTHHPRDASFQGRFNPFFPGTHSPVTQRQDTCAAIKPRYFFVDVKTSKSSKYANFRRFFEAVDLCAQGISDDEKIKIKNCVNTYL